MDGDGGKGRIRSFALGGLVGASAALAAMNRRRRGARRSGRPRGLAAFESSPCYLELVEEERERESTKA